jgi:hypothetical protein
MARREPTDESKIHKKNDIKSMKNEEKKGKGRGKDKTLKTTDHRNRNSQLTATSSRSSSPGRAKIGGCSNR